MCLPVPGRVPIRGAYAAPFRCQMEMGMRCTSEKFLLMGTAFTTAWWEEMLQEQRVCST
jgi:hypothetical protein